MIALHQKSIVLADYNALVREGLISVCESSPRYKVTGQCADSDMAQRMLISYKPDFAILDLSLPPAAAVEIMRNMECEGLKTRYLLLSTRPDRNLMLAGLRAGAKAVLPKSGPPSHLLDALEQVNGGAIYLSPMLNLRGTRVLDPRFHRDTYSTLSHREQQVFELLVDGVRAKEIAARLQLSPKTVDSHRASLMRKLDIYDTAGLVKYALQRNLTSIA